MEEFEDPILCLARDPNLNKEKGKTSQLIQIIHNFPLTERRISKLCQLSLTILQSLEKIELNLKNWQFLSLDINSSTHFDGDDENSHIKKFNNDIAVKVLLQCQDFQKKLHRISQDLDFITRSLRTLSPLEFILDSGTLLTQLTLRNIKLKDHLSDVITVAYLRAKLINIGTDLEEMLAHDVTCDQSVVGTYKGFVVSLLKQLNELIEQEDLSAKHECLAVISDMEKMFEAFKLEKLQEAAEAAEQEREEYVEREVRRQIEQQKQQQQQQQQQLLALLQSAHLKPPVSKEYVYDSPTNTFSEPMDDGYDSDMASSSMFSSSMYGSHHQPPTIHSITKTNSVNNSTNISPPGQVATRRDSVTSLSTSILHKTTISEEMPYLMSAFDLARNFGQDISHYKPKDEDENNKDTASNISSAGSSSAGSSFSTTPSAATTSTSPPSSHSPHFPHSKLASSSPLYSESTILKELPTASSYLFSNNSLLSKLGIKPQVITTDLPSRGNSSNNNNSLTSNTSANRGFMSHSFHGSLPGKENIIKEEKEKEQGAQKKIMSSSMPNLPGMTPLTSANLATLTQHGEVD